MLPAALCTGVGGGSWSRLRRPLGRRSRSRPGLKPRLTSKAATQKPKAEPNQLRPLPFLIYLADGDTAPGSYNVFASNLKGVQRVFKRYPDVDCSPPSHIGADLADVPGVQMQLAVVLQRCPHYTTNMAGKWGGATDGGSQSCCMVQ